MEQGAWGSLSKGHQKQAKWLRHRAGVGSSTVEGGGWGDIKFTEGLTARGEQPGHGPALVGGLLPPQGDSMFALTLLHLRSICCVWALAWPSGNQDQSPSTLRDLDGLCQESMSSGKAGSMP